MEAVLKLPNIVNKNSLNKEVIVYSSITFFLFSFLGWIWEGIYVGAHYGTFLNRGFLHGPYLPIYGFGGVLILALLSDLHKHWLKVFSYAVLISGLLEYSTSYILEMVFHRKWWDYSNKLLNIQGRVCLVNLLLFGAVGVLAVCIILPLLKRVYSRIPMKIISILCLFITVLFFGDLLLSLAVPNAGIGITY